VTHGSRDPRPQAALEQLAQGLRERLAALVSPDTPDLEPRDASALPLVGTGTLELGSLPLDEQIKQFGAQALSRQLTQVQLVPLFLLPGVHVKEDIPAAVGIAQQALGEQVQIALRPQLGIHAGLAPLIAHQMATLPVEAWILLAHGSRRRGGNVPIQAMAAQLNAVPAYWSMPPKLERRVKELVAAGYQQIGVMPYFLFAGSTTDAIAQEVERLGYQFPQINLRLAAPLEPSAAIAELLLDLIHLPAALGSVSLPA
ncbi:MAG TPA: sirohydrochlorin chelatase, partial [Candidatus Caenarcaniphilales bacterium]